MAGYRGSASLAERRLSHVLSQDRTVSSRPLHYLYIGHVGQWEKCYGYLTI